MAKRHADPIGRTPVSAAVVAAVVSRKNEFKLIRDSDWTCHEQAGPRATDVSKNAVDRSAIIENDAAAFQRALSPRLSSLLHGDPNPRMPFNSLIDM